MKDRSNLQSQHPPMPRHVTDPHRSPAAPAHGAPHAPSVERDRKLKRHNEHPDQP